MDKKFLAIIPARAGSKTIPRKNIRLFNGKPLIYYSIVEALNSDHIDRVIVSTEDEEIAEIATKFKAEVVKRPKELAEDDTPTIDVVLHVLDVLRSEDYNPDGVVLLQPTSPLRVKEDIESAIGLFMKNSNGSLVSVSEVKHTPYWSFKIERGTLVPLFEKRYLKTRRQELPKVYAPNGAVFIAKTEELRSCRSFYMAKILPYIMPAERSIDIDEETDFILAELIMKKLKKTSPRRNT